MNLDNEEKQNKNPEPKTSEKKKLTRKEKKALKKADKAALTDQKTTKEAPPKTDVKKAEKNKDEQPEEVEAKLDPAPVEEIPAPTYTTWEKISPPARRKKQITNMEHGFREVLALVHSMRNNQEVLMDAFQKLPEAVDSVKKLADHSAQQADLLRVMNEQMGTASAGDFNKTLTSMDQTTQLLLERSQRSEEKLYSMLKQAQRRIAFMTLLVILLFLGAVATVMLVFFPEQTNEWLNGRNMGGTEAVEQSVSPTADSETVSDIMAPPPAVEVPLQEIPDAETDDVESEPVIDPLPETLQESEPTATEDIPDSASEDINESTAEEEQDSQELITDPEEPETE